MNPNVLESGVLFLSCMFIHKSFILARDIERITFIEFDFFDFIDIFINVILIFSIWRLLVDVSIISDKKKFDYEVMRLNKDIELEVDRERNMKKL